MKHAIQSIHFVGIGGAGMSGIAQVLHQLGYQVSGSDQSDSDTLQRLGAMGIRTFVGHAAQHVGGAQAVVTSTAVRADNPEVCQARALNIPVVPRAHMLAELMRGKQGIAIAGTHGKTTTTSLVTSVLAAAGLDPSFVIGGRLNSAAANGQLGQGEHIVVEADESDASFLHLLPVMAVVTNIDADHMETYGQDFACLQQAFVDFLNRMPFYGRAVLCTDVAAVRDIVAQVRCPVIGYGLDEGAQLRAVNVRAMGDAMHFTVQRNRLPTPLPDVDVVLNLPGVHNVRNALSAIALAAELHIADAAWLKALREFQGVGRRFQRYGTCQLPGGGEIAVVDDYGHHPVEIQATLAAARGVFGARRLVLAFQPHRYTRTRDCFAEFVATLALADAVVLAEVYAAGEPPIAGADAAALAAALRTSGLPEPVLVVDVANMALAIVAQAQPGDVVLCMGAGSIDEVAGEIVKMLQKYELPTQSGCAL